MGEHTPADEGIRAHLLLPTAPANILDASHCKNPTLLSDRRNGDAEDIHPPINLLTLV